MTKDGAFMTTPHNPFGNDGSTPDNSSPYGGDQGNAQPFGATGNESTPYGGTQGGYQEGANGFGSYPADGNFAAQNGGLRPENYLPWSIINTVLSICTCCIPIGAVAIFFSLAVNSKFQKGDVAGAQSASKTAKTVNIVFSVIIGVLLLFQILNYFFNWIPLNDTNGYLKYNVEK